MGRSCLYVDIVRGHVYKRLGGISNGHPQVFRLVHRCCGVRNPRFNTYVRHFTILPLINEGCDQCYKYFDYTALRNVVFTLDNGTGNS